MNALIIIGAGGFGREVLALCLALDPLGERWRTVGFVDDAPTEATEERLRRAGAALLGGLDVLRSAGPTEVLVAVGDPTARLRIVRELEPASHLYPTLVHPHATVGPDVALGRGCVIAPGARLSTAITVDEHVHIDQNVTVGHDTVIGAGTRLNPGACVSGSVTLGSAVTIGANATVLQGLTVGGGATVGAGSVVTRDVSPGQTVKGVPAR